MRIAVVGSGISGLLCSYLLSRRHDVHVFEASASLGGHTNTVTVEHAGRSYSVDTGFIVYNELNYPNLTHLLAKLSVPTQATAMSFSVRSDHEGLEYNGESLGKLFAQRRNLVRPGFWRMLLDIMRFYRSASRLLAEPDMELTLREYLQRERYSREFSEWHILPMASAIWSTDLRGTGEIPLHALLAFFQRHGFLRVSGRPQWRTIVGGSSTYVRAMSTRIGSVHLRQPIRQVHRRPSGVDLVTSSSERLPFDSVVIATHSDQALALLADPAPTEREVLQSIRYQRNHVALHTDSSLLPRSRRAWASWNYHLFESDRKAATVTYNMNMLQRLEAPVQFCVTLNHHDAVDPQAVIRTFEYEHPHFDRHAVAARKRHSEINGQRNTYYCGAYWGDGFHEDGVNSALAVCRQFGEDLGT